MKELSYLLLAACLLPCALVRQAEAATFYVAPDGSDLWSGKLRQPGRNRADGPFKTLERARDAVRALKDRGRLPKGGIVVELRPGLYEMARPLELTARDSGTAACPVIYRSRQGQPARLAGGKVITGWEPVTDPAILRRMDESARGKVVQADLKGQVEDLGKMEAGTSWGASRPGLEVFFKDAPMTLARWPNEGFVTIPEVLGPTPQDIRGTKGCMEGIFTYEGDRPARWVGEKDVMLHGYWFWDWADQRLKVSAIDTGKRAITLDSQPQHAYGFRKGMYYYAYNLLPELDRPGEWYLDRESGILYFWPPEPIEGGKVTVSVLPTLVEMKDVSYLTLQGLTFECTRDTAITAVNADHVRVAGCAIRNTGGWGLDMSGRESGIAGCDLYNLADGGIVINGGDRKTLTPARMYVDNCHFYRFGRWNPIVKPAVSINGVGNRVTHCLINDAPHIAIMWGGNDHLFEFNELHSVVYGANDAGIMYAGFNPTTRGHIIRYNYFHHVYGFRGQGCNGVYLDDMFCSALVYGNIFYKVPRAAFIGGGRDNRVENNIFVDCAPALHIDSRALGWAAPAMPTMKERLEEVPYREEPWRSRFPELLTYWNDEPAVPKGNVIARNICWGGSWDEVEASARPWVTFIDNLVQTDPKFADASRQDFRLKPDSPAWKLGFKPIPAEKIGLYKDSHRITWPVKTEVRDP
ncbi:MAG: right-handed parallel beta-helix repeat-containing protein [Armatimonadetes bacterium]|nr:right-handed parallel beta-helix repeat-containing protein [Armatimonadota bacterium]